MTPQPTQPTNPSPPTGDDPNPATWPIDWTIAQNQYRAQAWEDMEHSWHSHDPEHPLYQARGFYRNHAGRDLNIFDLAHWPELDLPPNPTLTPYSEYINILAAYTRRQATRDRYAPLPTQRNPRAEDQIQIYQSRINIRNNFITALHSPATTAEDIAFRANYQTVFHRDPAPADVPRWRDLAIPVPQTVNLEQRFASFAREHMLLACIPLPTERQTQPQPPTERQTQPQPDDTDIPITSPTKPANITRTSVRHSPDLSDTRRAKSRLNKAQQDHTHQLCCNSQCNTPTPHNAPRCSRTKKPMHIECVAPEITQTICLSCYALVLDFSDST